MGAQLGETLRPTYKLFAPEHYGCEHTGPWTGSHAFTLADEAARIIDLINRSVSKVHLKTVLISTLESRMHTQELKVAPRLVAGRAGDGFGSKYFTSPIRPSAERPPGGPMLKRWPLCTVRVIGRPSLLVAENDLDDLSFAYNALR
jgi:hypothetical protein